MKPSTATSHGFSGYVEAPRAHELPNGTPAPPLVEKPAERKPNGQFAKGARTVQVAGGRVGVSKLAHHIGSISDLPPIWRGRARAFRKSACAEIARDVGGGSCGVVASAMVKLAAEALALAEYALEKGDFDQHRKLGESARMHLVYAREHAAKAALARRMNQGPEQQSEMLKRLGIGGPDDTR